MSTIIPIRKDKDMACNCRGGPTCCMRAIPTEPPVYIQTNIDKDELVKMVIGELDKRLRFTGPQ